MTFPLSLHGLDVWGNEVSETGLHIESGDLDGFNRGVEGTLVAVPWPNDCAEEHEAKTAQLILQTYTDAKAPFMGCARTVLARQVEVLAAKGRYPVCAFELEFHLLKVDGAPRGNTPGAGAHVTAAIVPPGDAQLMYGLGALAEKYPVFSMIEKAARWAGLPVDTVVKEAGPDQFEVNLTHRADALRAADDVVLLKRIVVEAARAQGLRATFMGKPFIDQPGNGMHVHVSLADGAGVNIFADPTDGETALSSAAAGLVDTMAEMALVFINTRNGFRRMAEGSYAPVFANWGENNRSVARVDEHQRHLRHRVHQPSCCGG
ncbi:MAG: glutamine synthetase, partial [Pseudomonadota bacterium]